MSDYAWFTGTFVMTIFLLVILIDMAQYNANVTCPIDVQNLYQRFNHSDYIGGTLSMLGLFVSPCSGLPWWVYTILLILIIGDIIFLTPFVGS